MILNVHQLYKSFGKIQAVDDVDLQVVQGEILGLLGPNGAGKTTLISMLAGLQEADQGEITFDGRPFTPKSRRYKSSLGLVPQEMALYPTLSARDNLLFFGRIYGLNGQRLKCRVEEVLKIVGLRQRADERIETYSGGMKRRINIAAGLLHKPRILFLDEPTVGVDPQSRNAIFETVEDLNRQGLTILYTTHYMEEAQRLCHRVAIMDEGRIIALDTPQALIERLGGGVIRLGLHNGQLEAVKQRGESLETVKSIVHRGGKLIIETHQAHAALMGLLEVVNQFDARLTSLEILEPNLETVFLSLTGKHLRD